MRNHQKNKNSQLSLGWETNLKIKCEVCSSWPTNIIWEQFTSEIRLEVPFPTPVKATGQMLVLRLFMSYHPLKWSERLLLVSNAQLVRPTDCDKGGCSIPVMWAQERSTMQMKYKNKKTKKTRTLQLMMCIKMRRRSLWKLHWRLESIYAEEGI